MNAYETFAGVPIDQPFIAIERSDMVCKVWCAKTGPQDAVHKK